jgi:hypothetical protein
MLPGLCGIVLAYHGSLVAMECGDLWAEIAVHGLWFYLVLSFFLSAFISIVYIFIWSAFIVYFSFVLFIFYFTCFLCIGAVQLLRNFFCQIWLPLPLSHSVTHSPTPQYYVTPGLTHSPHYTNDFARSSINYWKLTEICAEIRSGLELNVVFEFSLNGIYLLLFWTLNVKLSECFWHFCPALY